MAIDRDNLTLRHIRDVEDEVLKQFSCGRSQLDEFLHDDARDYDAHGLTSIVVDPADPEGRRALSRLFQVEIGLELAGERVRIGERVHVLFDHGYEPLGRQWFRALHQLFLRRFHA